MKPMRFLSKTFSCISFCLSTVVGAEDVPVNVWNKVYDSGMSDIPYAVTVDDSGYIYVAGTSLDVNNTDFRTIKFDPEGEIVWNKTYGAESEDIAWAVAVSKTGSVYVAGESKDSYELVKYDSKGNELFNKTYESQYKYSDAAYGLALDEDNGFCYLTGKVHNTTSGNNDYRIIKCDTSGGKKWDNKFDSGGEDCSYAVTVDENGFIYVTGSANDDSNVVTIKYGPTGNKIWEKSYSKGDKNVAYAITADKAGFFYITGMSKNDGDMDYCTVKYDLAGNLKWEKLYGASNNEFACDVAFDSKGFLYVTGLYYEGSYPFSRTMKYDSLGNIQWEVAYDQGSREESEGVAVDAFGNVYIICKSYNGKDNDFRLLKYRQSSGISESRPEPGSLGLEITSEKSVVTVSYTLTNPGSVELAVFDVRGSKIGTLDCGYRESGIHTLSWVSCMNGVYFIRFSTRETVETRKVVVIR